MILDGYADPGKLDDTELVRKLFVDLVEDMGMEIINGPTVVSFKESSGDKAAGLSGSVLIATSHLYIHTWPEESYFAFDVFSCEPFDEGTVESIVCTRLGMANSMTDVVRWRVDQERAGPPR